MSPEDQAIDADNALLEALKGRAVLLLGQGRFSRSTTEDDLSIRGRATLGANPCKFLLAGPGSAEDRQIALAKLSEATPLAEAAGPIASLPWSAILTSAVDSEVARPFAERKDRLTVEVTSPEFAAMSADGAVRIARIFGALHREHIEERPPTSEKDLRTRMPKAQQFLAQLPDVVGPNGVLVVSGWNPGEDWIRLRDLPQPLASLAAGQVLIFGVDAAGQEKLAEDEDFAALIEDGVVTVLPIPLGQAIRRLQESGRLASVPGVQVRDTVVVRVIADRAPLENQRGALVDLVFTGADWRQHESRLVIPIPMTLTEPTPSDPAQLYHEFREFVSKQPGRETLRFAATYAFHRPEIDQLTRLCHIVCHRSSPQESAIVVRGQSGAGKSILLNLLVVRLRSAGLPVAYLPPGALPPDRGAIDLLCQRIAEKSEAPLFLIYDGLREAEDYFDLARYFASRGRKCVVVGSAYAFQAKGRTMRRTGQGGRRSLSGITEEYLDVDVALKPDTVDELLRHISKFLGTTAEALRAVAPLGMGNFFAIVYRSIPVTRGPLEGAFIRECASGGQFLEQSMRDLAEVQTNETAGMSTMELAFRNAVGKRLDLLAALSLSADASADDARQMSEAARSLFDAVMLSSHLGQELPQSIALRLLSHKFRTYRGAFTAGLLDEREVAVGEYALGARSAVEADIWVRRHLPRREDWVATVARLLGATATQAMCDDYSREIEFILGLLRAIGPQAPPHLRCDQQFGELSEHLAALRLQHGEVSVRLLLMESHLAREWVHKQQTAIRDDAQRETNFEPLVQKLEQAEAGLRQAWDKVHRETASQGMKPAVRRLLATLETERACVLGTMLGSITRCLPNNVLMSKNVQTRADGWADAARGAWTRSLNLDESHRMAIDSACWIVQERWKIGFSNGDSRVVWLARWSDVIDRYQELELTTAQEDRRDGRERELRDALGDEAGVRAAVARIEARGGSEGRSLLARLEARSGGAQAGREYLERVAGEAILEDELLLPLFLRFWWEEHTGLEGFLPRERLQVALTPARWKRLLTLIEARIRFEPANGTMLFLRAAALIHLGDSRGGIEQLREVDRLGVGGYRAAKSLMLRCDGNGVPQEFVGVYQGRTAGSAHLAWCDRLHENVQFHPVEFGKPDIRAGASVGPFILSIRYRGLFAERSVRTAGAPSRGGR